MLDTSDHAIADRLISLQGVLLLGALLEVVLLLLLPVLRGW